MKKTIIFLFVLVSFISCTKSQKINNNTENKKNMPNIIENLLRKQILAGYSENEEGLDGSSSYTYTNQDMEVNLTLSEDILKKQGYRFTSEQEFQDKAKRIFDFSNEKNPINFLIEYPCSQKKHIYQLDINGVMSNNLPIYLYLDKRILVEPLFIPELIDYKKEYPQILKEETLIPEKRKSSDGFNLKLTKWKDITDLSKQRQKNIETLVHRNKYLFNDNKASLTWLKFNDQNFSESLVKTFGYVEDKDLVKWVIDKTLLKGNDIEEINKLFYNKNCKGDFIFHTETFQVIKDNIKTKYLDNLYTYVDDIDTNKQIHELTFSQKAIILAHALYIGEFFAQHEKYGQYRFKFMGKFYEWEQDREKYNLEFQKNNYYNLPEFKKLWEEAKEDGDGISLPGEIE